MCGCSGASMNSCGNCSGTCVNEGDSCGISGCGTCSAGGGGPTHCFVAGTKIRMADGTDKNIENVRVGDKILSYNFNSEKVEEDIVERTDHPTHDDLVTIETEHSTNTNTHDHPYFSVLKNSWVSYKPELTKDRYINNGAWGPAFEEDEIDAIQIGNPQSPVGDIALYIDEDGNLKESKFLSIKENNQTTKTYNLTRIKNNHNFFANGLLVHNKGGGGSGRAPKDEMQSPDADKQHRMGGRIGYRMGGRVGNDRSSCPTGYFMDFNGICQQTGGY